MLFVFSSTGSVILLPLLVRVAGRLGDLDQRPAGSRLKPVLPASPISIEIAGLNGTVSQPVVANRYGGPSVKVGSS